MNSCNLRKHSYKVIVWRPYCEKKNKNGRQLLLYLKT